MQLDALIVLMVALIASACGRPPTQGTGRPSLIGYRRDLFSGLAPPLALRFESVSYLRQPA
jgi:hypothetical protein